MIFSSELEKLIRRCLQQAIDANNREGIRRWSYQLNTLLRLKQGATHA